MNTNSKVLIILLIIFFCVSLPAQKIDKKVLLRSAIIPGWGEISQQSKTGYIFAASELISWCSYFYFLEEAELKKKASKNFAIQFAHIPIEEDYPPDYFDHLSRYDNSGYGPGGYNAYIFDIANSKFPDDEEARMEYIEQNEYPEELYWSWDDDDKQHDYAISRKRITQYTDYAQTITGMFIVNRLLSMLNSIRVNSKLKNVHADIGFTADLKPLLMIKYKLK